MSRDTGFNKASRHVIIQYLAKMEVLNEWLDRTNDVTYEVNEYGNEYTAEEDDLLAEVDGSDMVHQSFTPDIGSNGEKWNNIKKEVDVMVNNMKDLYDLIGE